MPRRNTVRRLLLPLICAGIVCLFGIDGALAAGPHSEGGSAVRVIERPNLVPEDISLFHGYQVYHFDLINTDAKRAHQAILRCGGFRKTVEIPAGQTVRVNFPIPSIVNSYGFYEVAITFDDSMQSYRSSNQITNHIVKLSAFGYYHGAMLSGFKLGRLLVSQGLKNAIIETEKMTAKMETALWPTDWLDYSPYDCIAITEDEFTCAPKPVQNAIRDWVSAGGNLWVFKAKLDSPALSAVSWFNRALEDSSADETNGYMSSVGYWGFGQVLILDLDLKAVFEEQGIDDSFILAGLEKEYIGYDQNNMSNCWFVEKPIENIHAEFPIVNSLALPWRSILVIMIVFALLAGPVGYFVLMRRNQRIFLLAFVPALSLVTAGGIVAFIIVSEGFNTEYRYSAVTFLDQQEGLASTIGQFGYYARTSPRGFSFDAQTELYPLSFQDNNNTGRRSRAASPSMNWTARQELVSGWISPRVPAYFKARKTKPSRLKLTFQFPSETAATVVNGLGAPIKKLTVRDAQNRFWFADNIAPGAKANLTPTQSNGYREENNKRYAYDYYQQSTWQVFPSTPPIGWYVAELDANGPTDSPFLEKGLPYAYKVNCSESVIGTIE